MKQPASAVIEGIGSFSPDAQAVKMGIDPASLGKIMMILTDLYPDPMMAVIREYSTNAWDAHVDAGVTRPIEVTLPSAFNPFLKIRDFGTGMDEDTMVRVYSQYGVSTKDNENVSNGMFGIGGKSALTYAQQFTVVAVKNGIRLTALINRIGAEATMTIIDQRPTAESNGVEVSIPVKHSDANDFSRKAAYLYSFWKPGTVLVNGREPAKVALKMVTDKIGTTTSLESDVIVMGNVPYKVGSRLYDHRNRWGRNNFQIVAFVEIGDVDIPPSREEIQMTPKSEVAIDRIKKNFVDRIQKTITDDIASAANHADAYQRYTKWAADYGQIVPSTLTYNGDVLPRNFKFNYAQWNSNGYRGGWTSGRTEISIEDLMQCVVIHGFDIQGLTKTHKDKIKKWKDDNGIVASRHLFTDVVRGTPWLDSKRIVSWSDIKAIKLPSRGAVNGQRVKPSIDVFNPVDGRLNSIHDLDKTKVPVYISPTARMQGYMAVAITNVLPECQIVVLGENRWDKFKRENPKSMGLVTYVKQRLAEARDALTTDDIKALSMDSTSKRRLGLLDDKQVDDPALAEMIRIANGTYKSATLDTYEKIVGVCYRMNIYPKPFDEKDYVAQYPLLASVNDGILVKNHTYLYLNAVYAANV